MNEPAITITDCSIIVFIGGINIIRNINVFYTNESIIIGQIKRLVI